jgi:hypothetical protein
MKKLAALFVISFVFLNLHAQDSTVAVPSGTDSVANLRADTAGLSATPDSLRIITPPSVIDEDQQPNRKRASMPPIGGLPNVSRDHLLLQFGIVNWTNKPDSIKTKGFSRTFNVYFMYDFPFKTNPHLSIGAGVGVASDNMYFSSTTIDIAGKTSNRLNFRKGSDTTHYKKYKLMNTYLEAPIELRYVADPLHPKKSFKAAAGIKVGTLLGATTKGKTLQNSAGQTILAITQKEKSKRFFNTTRISATGRIGFGALSLFASYQLNPFIKQGFGPDVRPLTVGITLSGL